MKKRLFFTLLVTILNITLYSQIFNSGNFIIRNFSPDEYVAGSQNWSVTQDNRGVMYFGNSQSLLEYNALNWQNYYLPNSPPVRSVDVNPKGEIFIGAFSDFGFLAVNKNGSREYVSLN